MKHPEAVLAIDQGTTSTKAFVLTAQGVFTACGSLPHRAILPRDGWVEQDASELIGNIETLIDRALAAHPEIRAVALANQGETVVAWDRESRQPLHHAIVWQDQRTQSHLDALPDATKRTIVARSGLPTDAYFSASKIAWLLAEVEDVATAARAGRLGIGTSDSFFIHRLTGLYLTDPTTASRTSLVDMETGHFDAELGRAFGVPLDLLAAIAPTGGAFGTIRRAGRELPLVVSVVDQQAALFGHGCRAQGDAKITFGTGSFALAVSSGRPVRDRDGLVPTVAWQFAGEPPLFALEGGDYTAAAAVDWAIAIGLATSFEDFVFADPAPAILRKIAFVPALAGLAAPYWRREVAATFMGLRQSTTAADLRKALLEGIAYRGAQLVEALCGAGTSPISIDGGLARNAYFVQFLADALGRPVRLQESADLTGLGAAQMAFHALGRPVPNPADATSRLVRPGPLAADIAAQRPYFEAAIEAATRLASGEEWLPRT